MPKADTTPAHASVAFLRIPRFDSHGVSEQAALKKRLEARCREALGGIGGADRAVLDADDGLAVVVFGDPARALAAVEAMARDGDPLQVGVNYGPLALTAKGPEGRVFGDGLTAAAAAARFASPERPLVTHDFHRALEAADPGRAGSFSPVGDFTDTRVRMHSLYAADPAKRAASRRRALRRGALGVAAILFLGFSARFAHHVFLSMRPAVLTLAVKPRGEVFVDGVPRGRTPPLTQLEVPAGRHVISVRHPGFAPFERTLDLKPGERREVAHTFAVARPPEPKGGFWQDLRRRFGGSR